MQAPILLAILEYGLLMAMKRLWPKKTTVDVMKENPNKQGVYQKVEEKNIRRFVKKIFPYIVETTQDLFCELGMKS